MSVGSGKKGMEGGIWSRKIPYFDAHCDTLTLETDNLSDILLENPHFSSLKLGLESYSPRAQVFAIYVDSGSSDFDPDKIFNSSLKKFHHLLSLHPEKLAFCRSSEDLDRAVNDGKIAAFLSIEGAEVLSCSLEKLEYARLCGVRITGITWNRANVLSGSCVERENEGLTPQGIRFVDKALAFGMILDVSHLSSRGTDEVIERCKGKAFASHSNSKSVCPHKRNLTDEQFINLVNSGGLCCINLYTPFLSAKTATAEDAADHIFYLAGLAPSGIKHIGIGADFDGCDRLPKGLESSEKVELLYSTLIRRGLTAAEADGVYYYNMYNFIKRNI